jgi:hypothetical protein
LLLIGRRAGQFAFPFHWSSTATTERLVLLVDRELGGFVTTVELGVYIAIKIHMESIFFVCSTIILVIVLQSFRYFYPFCLLLLLFPIASPVFYHGLKVPKREF